MAFNYKIDKHAECHVAKSLASRGGAHILNILLEEDMDNGMVVSQGDYVERDVYKGVKGSKATFVVRQQDVSGYWLIEVVEPGDEFILTTVPIDFVGYENLEWQDDAIYYNGKDDVARAHGLSKFDTYLVSADAVAGELAAGASLNVADGKLTVA